MSIRVIYRIAATAVACILGAGFVSGQELWQFFGAYGRIGFVGAFVSVLLFCGACAVVLWLSSDMEEGSMEGLVYPGKPPLIRWSVTAFEMSFHFILYVLMTAATGALGARYGLPFFTGAAFFCVVCTLVSLSGVKGVVRIFSFLVPFLVLSAIVIAIYSLGLPEGAICVSPSVGSPLTGNWFVSALVYFSFNFVASVPILASVGHDVRERGMPLGALLATVPLGLLAACLIYAMLKHPGASAFDLPMMELAAACGKFPGTLYALLLLGGIFATGFSSQASLNRYFEGFGIKSKRLGLLSACLSLVAFLLGLFGFKDLISVAYPILGYIGIVPLIFIFTHALIRFIGKQKRRKQ